MTGCESPNPVLEMERWPVALIFVAGAAFGALGAMTWSACMAVARQPRDGEEAAVFELKGQLKFCERYTC